MLSRMDIDVESIRSEVDKLIIYGRVLNLLARCFTQDLDTLIPSLRELGEALRLAGLESYVDDVRSLLDIIKGNESVIEEYTRLFEFGDISLYESDYVFDVTSPSKLYLKADVSGFYKAFGLKHSGDLPDHISAELEFLSFLFIKEAFALMEGDEDKIGLVRDARMKFWGEHLGSWYRKLVEKVKEKTDNEYYLKFFDLLAGILDSIFRDIL